VTLRMRDVSILGYAAAATVTLATVFARRDVTD
jgi:hypothetical protein